MRRGLLGRLLGVAAVGATLAVAPAVPAAAAPTNCSTGLIGTRQALYVVCTGGTGTVQMQMLCHNYTNDDGWDMGVYGNVAPVGVRSEAYCPLGGWSIVEWGYVQSD